MQLPTEPQTIVRLTVDSFKRLRAAHVQPSRTGLVPVRGRNGQGKSSLIESMIAALLGRKGTQALPITEGEHGADVLLELGQLTVRRTWKRDSGGKAKTTLTVTGSDGVDIPSPQAILDALCGEFADPVAFLDMKAADQVKTTLNVLGLGGEVAAIEKDADEAYDERTVAGREADRFSKAMAALEVEVSGLPAPPTEGTIEELAAELQEANERNGAIDDDRKLRENIKTRGIEFASRRDQLKTELARIEDEMEKSREHWTQVNMRLDIAQATDVEPIMVSLRQHEEAAKHAGRRELLVATRAQAEEAQATHDAADRLLADLRGQIAALLAAAEFPIEGVTYDPEAKVLKIGGIPFDQASQGERIKLAAGVAMMGSPTIRVMFAREGSLLDHTSQAQLAAIAEAHGFQLWLEVVDDNPEGAGIFIEDGEVVG
tara:strand:- start:9311 stop:10603 length:1293 start_codon:yes stop_codon:yes gene_type:complete